MSESASPKLITQDAKPHPVRQNDTRFKTAFAHRLVEMVCAFSMLVGGMIIAIVGSSPGWAAGGSFAAALGGVLFSWSMASLNSREQAAEILRPHLETSSKLLGTVSGQIARTIQDVNTGRYDANTGLAMMRQANATLYNIVSDMQGLIGTEFDSTGLTDLIERLHELAARVSRDPKIDNDDDGEEGELEDADSLKSEIETLRRQIATQLVQRGVTPTELRAVRIECPECTASVPVNLGTAAGSTASPWCPACGAHFNVHRKADGSTFARPGGVLNTFRQRPPYEQILRAQGLNLPDVSTREKGLRALARAITARPKKRVQSWEDLEGALSAELEKEGVTSDLSEVKRLRQLGYRTRLYDLNATLGIGLRDGITVENICTAVNKQLASRIFQSIDKEIDLPQLATVLFGDPARTEEATAIATEFDSIQRRNPDVAGIAQQDPPSPGHVRSRAAENGGS